MKECDAMFPTSTDSLNSVVPCQWSPAAKKTANYCAATSHSNADLAGNTIHTATNSRSQLNENKAETVIKLMLMAGQKLSGKTLGIIGFGRIGRETAHRAHFGFGMKVVVHSRSSVATEDLVQIDAGQVDDIDDLLNQSDFVSLHCPADEESRHLIDALRLNEMKPDAYLINTACSELVDEEALADALWYDTIAGAGLDIDNHEPGVCRRLAACENVVLLHPSNLTTGSARETN